MRGVWIQQEFLLTSEGGVVCMMKSAPVVRCSVTQVSVALPRPYIGGVGGPCWISLYSVWTPPSGPCWFCETSQWVPVVLLILWDFSVGANMLVYLHLWWYLRLLLHFIPVFLVSSYCSVTQVYIGVVVEAFRSKQAWVWGACVGVFVSMCVSRKYWCVWSLCTCANTFMYTTHPQPCTVCNLALLSL